MTQIIAPEATIHLLALPELEATSNRAITTETDLLRDTIRLDLPLRQILPLPVETTQLELEQSVKIVLAAIRAIIEGLQDRAITAEVVDTIQTTTDLRGNRSLTMAVPDRMDPLAEATRKENTATEEKALPKRTELMHE